jgi:hypothetical protein
LHDHDFNKTSVLMEVEDQPGALHEVSLPATGLAPMSHHVTSDKAREKLNL